MPYYRNRRSRHKNPRSGRSSSKYYPRKPKKKSKNLSYVWRTRDEDEQNATLGVLVAILVSVLAVITTYRIWVSDWRWEAKFMATLGVVVLYAFAIYFIGK